MGTRRSHRNLIPDPITRILALHGPIKVSCGQGARRISVNVHCAPFDDLLVLFTPLRSPLIAALDRDPRVGLIVQGGETNYTVRIQGRGVATGTAGAHERRMELVPWLPEGSTLQQFRAVELVPERIEYAYDEGEERRHYEGRTEAGKLPTAAGLWLRLCFAELVPAVALAMVGLFIGVAFQWFYFVWERPLAYLVSMVISLCLMAAGRVLQRSLSHRSWQRGRGPRSWGGVFSEGLVPLHKGRILAVALAVLAVVILIITIAMGHAGLAGISLLASQLWYLFPYWLVRSDEQRQKKPA